MKSLTQTCLKHDLRDPKTAYWRLLWLWIEDNAEEMSELDFAAWNQILHNVRRGEDEKYRGEE